jgi:3-oxoacyl-[acyl-carrier protein] reductase
MTSRTLSGEIAFITGASRGIGRAIALALGAEGETVIGTATGADGVVAIDEALRSAGIAGRGLVLDVADGPAIDAAVTDVESREGAISSLVNNAGITRDTLVLRMKPEVWDAVIDTNLGSVFRLSKAVLRGMMKARKGRIVNIASVVGLVGNPGQANYCAAKAGIGGFTRSLAREVASRGITVNVVAPGFIDTDMTKSLTDIQRQAMAAQIPLGRLGEPADIAAAVCFLAGPAAAWITGETLNVNGGMHMA